MTLILRTFIVSCVLLFAHAGMAKSGERAATQYPIVLAGGSIINFDTLGPFQFFYKIPEALRAEGADVYVSTVSAANSPEVRGEQLARQVEDILAITGKEKVNLISISSGGLTVRYTASVYPDLIASVTTINAGHAGSPMADTLYNLVEDLPDPLTNKAWKIVNKISKLIATIAGDDLEMNTEALAYGHTVKGSAEFSARHPEGMPTKACGQGAELAENGVRYYAYAGSKTFTNFFDPGDYIFGLSGKIFFGREPSDGAFGSCSSHWGKTIRDNLYLNHLDEANHMFGIRSPWLDPLQLYINQANRLKNLNL